MNLDELLTRTGAVDAPSPDVTDRARALVGAAARADIARRAVLVRRRRIARFGTAAVGLTTAAAVVGVVALQPSGSSSPAPRAGGPGSTVPVGPDFKTVAQVINAAVAATPNVDPTAAPYWKTVLSWHSYGTIPRLDGTSCIRPYAQITTSWIGNGHPSVFMNTGPQVGHDDGKPIAAGGGTVPFDGRMMTWRQINAGQWTDAQLATLVADSGSSGKDGRASSTYYVFKNTVELLQNLPASAAIRKRYWHMLGAMSGVRLDGRASDAVGRTGWKLSYSYPGYGAETAIVDTASGMLLQSGGSDQYSTVPSYATLISAGPTATAPTAQPEWNPSLTPPVKGSAEWKRAEAHRKLWKNWQQVQNQPTPYPACTPTDIANMS